ncbi:prolyl-tRNA synthetase associated domain-containing protein [Oscillospiraceae bacterium PP1C4]
MAHREAVFARLGELEIPYEVTEHPAVFTIEEMDKLGVTLNGDVCKNLFLRDAKGRRHFLVVLQKDKHADLKSIEAQLGCSRLSFASAQRLESHLGLHQGEVTPLGIVNDTAAAVEVVFDRDLVGKTSLGVHPNENTATVWISFEHVKRLVEHNGNIIHYVNI